MSALGLLMVLAATWAAGTWLVGLPVLLVARLALRRSAAGWIPLAMLAIPVVTASAVAAVVLESLVTGACHCALDAEPQLHLCALHPDRALPLLPAALATFALFGALAGRAAWKILRVRRLLSDIVRGGTPSPEHPRLVVANLGSPNALAVDAGRGRVLADARWWRELPADERDIVLAHELAHLERRDPRILAALTLASALLPGFLARPAIRQWRTWAEMSADAAAAERAGDPVRVAELITRHHRAAAGLAPDLAPSFGDAHGLEARVSALLGPVPPCRPGGDLTRGRALLIVPATALPLLADGLVHAAAECALALLG